MHPRPSTPVIYHWPFVRALLPLLPAFILLPFLAVKPNRRAEAWLVLVPFGLIAAAVSAGQQIRAGQVGEAFAYSYPYLVMLASSLCITSLMTYAMPAWSFLKKIVLIPALSFIPGAFLLVVTQGASGPQDLTLLVSYSLAALILLLSVTLAGRRCRKRWSLPRFSLLFYMWNLILVSGVILPVAGVQFLLYSVAGNVMLPIIMACLVASLLLFIIAYPFVLVEFLSPLYRERLKATFQVEKQPISL